MLEDVLANEFNGLMMQVEYMKAPQIPDMT